MDYNFKRLSDSELIKSMPDDANLIVESAGSIKKVKHVPVPTKLSEFENDLEQPDWNQSDPNTPDYLKNRPFYKDVKTTSAPVDITWDGTADGLTSSSNGNYYKVSDSVFTLEQFKQMSFVSNGVITSVTQGAINTGAGIITCWEGINAPVIVSDEAVEKRSNVPGGAPDIFSEPGVYFYSDGNVTRLYSTEPIEVVSISIKKLDEEFLPDTIARQVAVDSKMNMDGPSGTGSFSMNRKRGTMIGVCSHTEGYDATASGDYSHAEGGYSTASGEYSHAEGNSTNASGSYSHAEGQSTGARGDYSHAEGYATKASSVYQHAQGKYNIEDTSNRYAHIVGNGRNISNRSNAHTLDWEGNAWFAGTIEGTKLILKSTTSGSTKRFEITVDDSGTLTATEIT